MTDIPVTMRDAAQLWRYMQHQEDVQYERMARTCHIRYVTEQPEKRHEDSLVSHDRINA